MDVRASDTSTLAAKRIEFEKVAPVTQKPKRLGDDQLVAHAAANDDEKHESAVDSEANNDADQQCTEEGSPSEATAASDAGDGEHHILDVRV